MWSVVVVVSGRGNGGDSCSGSGSEYSGQWYSGGGSGTVEPR